MASDSKETDGDTSNIATTLGVINGAYLFKIPPKASSMGHMADTWPKKAMVCILTRMHNKNMYKQTIYTTVGWTIENIINCDGMYAPI